MCRRVLLAQLVLLLLLAFALPFTGRAMYREDPLEKSDAVYVLAGERVMRWLEAADLVREGWAPEIVLSGGYRDALEQRVLDRGIEFPSEGEVAERALMQLGVPAGRIRILGYVDNTAAEAALLRREALARHWSRVIVVTSKLHTRRAGFAMRRALDGTDVHVVMRASRYDDDDPSHFWNRRRTMRTMLSELPKFAAYLVGLGA